MASGPSMTPLWRAPTLKAGGPRNLPHSGGTRATNPPHHSSRVFIQAHSHLPFPPPSPACPWIPAFCLGAIQSPMRQLKPNIQKTKTMASSPITSWQIDGEIVVTVTDFIFLGSKITADGDCSHEIKTLIPWKESYDQPRQHIKKQRRHFANKGPFNQSYDFSSSHVWMWELDHKESWVLKNWCF